MAFGGISAGPKQFTGLDPREMKDMTAAETARARAIHFVIDSIARVYPDNCDYEVDFEGCMKGFLWVDCGIPFLFQRCLQRVRSTQMPFATQKWNQTQMKDHLNVLRNFLNYLLHHDVCKEFQDQIYAARNVLNTAEKELWMMAQAGYLLPGDFNKACSEIFGGEQHGQWTTANEWKKDDGDVDTSIMISPEHARKVFIQGLAACASTDDRLEKYTEQLKSGSKIADAFETGLEVTEIKFPTDEVLQLYLDDSNKGLKPVGKLNAVTWIPKIRPHFDLTEEEEQEAATCVPVIKEYEFWLEKEILENCFKGMKLTAQIFIPRSFVSWRMRR